MVEDEDRLDKKGISGFTKSWRHLPHFQIPNAVYFITSRCRLDQSGQHIELLPEERDIVFDAIKFLDGKKYDLYAVVVMHDHFHLIIQPTKKQDKSFFSISEIMHSIKGFSAHKINELNHKSPITGNKISRIIVPDCPVPVCPISDYQKNNKHKGQIWQHENFDRVIRDEMELFQKIEYIMNNPLKKGLCVSKDHYKWLYIK